MDRRNYRGNMGRRPMNPYRPNEPLCSDLMNDYTEDTMCERDDFDRDSERFPIGMCYVPWQRFRNLYENEFVALANGTLFKELDLKWYGRGCK